MNDDTDNKAPRNVAPPGMIIPRHGAGFLKPIQKGERRNPGGKGGLWHETQRIARHKSPEAARKLAELMHSPDERVALMAADKVLQWAWGKPQEYNPALDRGPPGIDTSRLSADGRRSLLALLRQVVQTEPAPEAEEPQPQQIEGDAVEDGE